MKNTCGLHAVLAPARSIPAHAFSLAAALVLTALLTAPSLGGATELLATPLTPAAVQNGGKAVSSRLVRTDPALLARTDTSRIAVVVKFDYDAIASYAGGSFAATSPAATGRALTRATVETSAY